MMRFGLLVANAGMVRKAQSLGEDAVASPTPALLCSSDGIEPLCRALEVGAKGNTLAKLANLLGSSEAEVLGFFEEIGVSGEVGCVDLCAATVRHAESLGFALPPQNNVGCVDAACKTTLELSPRSASTLAQHDLSLAGVTAYGSDAQTTYEGAVQVSSLFDDSAAEVSQLFGTPGEYPQSPNDERETLVHEAAEAVERPLSPQEATKLVSLLFGVYLRDGASHSSMIEVDEAGAALPKFGPHVPQEKYEEWNAYAMKGESLVSTALANVDSRADLIERWFSTGDEATRTQVKAMLSKVLRTMLALKIKVGQGGDCGGSTLAFVSVWRDGNKRFVKSEMEDSAYVVNVCDHFWESARALSYRYGTLIHESSHHHGPTDVVFAPEPTEEPTATLATDTTVVLTNVPAAVRSASDIRVSLEGVTASVVADEGETVTVKLSFFKAKPRGVPADLELSVPRASVRRGATAYGMGMCQKLVELQPAKALHNADNFMWAVMELAAEAVRAPGEWPCDIYSEVRPLVDGEMKVELYCTERITGVLTLRSYSGSVWAIQPTLTVEAHQPYTVRVDRTEDRDAGTFEFTATSGGRKHTIFTPPLVPKAPCKLKTKVAGDNVEVTVACVAIGSSGASGLMLSATTPEGTPADFRQMGQPGATPFAGTHLAIATPTASVAYKFPTVPYAYFGFQLSMEDHGRRYTVTAPAVAGWDAGMPCKVDVSNCRGERHCVETTATCRVKVENLELRYHSRSANRMVEAALSTEALLPYTPHTLRLKLNLRGRPVTVAGTVGGRKMLLWKGTVASH